MLSTFERVTVQVTISQGGSTDARACAMCRRGEELRRGNGQRRAVVDGQVVVVRAHRRRRRRPGRWRALENDRRRRPERRRVWLALW